MNFMYLYMLNKFSAEQNNVVFITLYMEAVLILYRINRVLNKYHMASSPCTNIF